MTRNELFGKLTLPKLDVNNENNKILLLTHTDMDGSGAAIVVNSVFKKGCVTVEHCSNGIMSGAIRDHVLNDADKYDAIFVCDISCNEEDAKIINESEGCKKLILIDHHKTAAFLNEYKWACVHPHLLSDSFMYRGYPEDKRSQANESGTGLMLDFMLYTSMLPSDTCQTPDNLMFLGKLSYMISAYDTWDWNNLLNAKSVYKDLSTLHLLYGIEYFETEMLNRMERGLRINIETDIFTETDNLLLTIERNKIKEHIENISNCFATATIHLDGKYYSAVFCSTGKYLAEVFEAMKNEYPNHDLYIVNYGTGISMRTKSSDINIGDIVKKRNGGGHPSAGGFKIPFEMQAKHIEEAFDAEMFDISKPRRN